MCIHSPKIGKHVKWKSANLVILMGWDCDFFEKSKESTQTLRHGGN